MLMYCQINFFELDLSSNCAGTLLQSALKYLVQFFSHTVRRSRWMVS
jgi:hypothetical protein